MTTALRTPFVKSRVMQIKVRHLLLPLPSPPPPPCLKSGVWSSSLCVRLSLQLEDVHSKLRCLGGSFHCSIDNFVITNRSDVLIQMKRHITVIIYSSFRPGLSRKQKGRLLRS